MGPGLPAGHPKAGETGLASSKRLFLPGGTESSNPLSSSGESPANLSFRRIKTSRELDVGLSDSDRRRPRCGTRGAQGPLERPPWRDILWDTCPKPASPA